MALARSASGPGGLSINTNSANSIFGSGTTPAAPAATGGMFGNVQAAKPATGLFGQSTTTTTTTTTSAPQAGGLFGSTTAPQSGGLFGSTAAASTQSSGGGGLFGSTSAAPQTSGLFGSTAATSAPQTGGLFGSTNAPAQTQPSGGLFGATNTTTQPQPSGGLFGNLGTQTNNQTAGAGGLFGSSTAAQPVQNAGGLFGNTQNQNQGTSSLFGNLNNNQNQQSQAQAQTQPSLFSGFGQQQQPQQSTNSNMFNGSQLGGRGGLAFGAGLTSAQQALQQGQPPLVPGVRIDLSNLRGTTRFNDLHEDLQKQIVAIDTFIQQQLDCKNQCDALVPAHQEMLSAIPNDADFCRRKLIGMEDAMESDIEKLSQVRELVKIDADHAKLSFKAIDNLRLPAQYHNAGIWAVRSTSTGAKTQVDGDGEAQDLVGFFSKTADELDGTLNKYRKNFSEIEYHLRSIESNTVQQTQALIAQRNGGSGGQDDPIQELAAALREFEMSILGVAGKVGAAREGMQSLQLGNFIGSSNGRSTNGRRTGGVY